MAILLMFQVRISALGATSADVVAPKKIGSASRGNYDVLNKIVYLDAGHGGYDQVLLTLVFLKRA